MQFSYTEDGWVMYFIVSLLFVSSKKLRHFALCQLLLLAGRAGIPRNNVLETTEISGIETIQIYLELTGGCSL